jgi:hypothetical protein
VGCAGWYGDVSGGREGGRRGRSGGLSIDEGPHHVTMSGSQLATTTAEHAIGAVNGLQTSSAPAARLQDPIWTTSHLLPLHESGITASVARRVPTTEAHQYDCSGWIHHTAVFCVAGISFCTLRTNRLQRPTETCSCLVTTRRGHRYDLKDAYYLYSWFRVGWRRVDGVRHVETRRWTEGTVVVPIPSSCHPSSKVY